MKRSGLRITGEDRTEFLQGLFTNDIERVSEGLVYSALLTPQGKYLADFFLMERDGGIIIDVKAECADDLRRRMTMYRLRSNVQITEERICVMRGIGKRPTGALDDPRHPSLGWRLYGQAGNVPEGGTDWDSIRVRSCVPESLVELVPNQTYILEAGFDRLNGVDFRKGCFVGQEVTARMRHKTRLRKGLVTVRIDGEAPIGQEVTQDGRSVGVLYSQSNGYAIAHLRFDRLKSSTMQAGSASIERIEE